MAAAALDFAPASTIRDGRARDIVLCHFTLAHAQLKSRSFHRMFSPLSAAGFAVRYVSPASIHGQRGGIDFIRIVVPAGRIRRLLGALRLLRGLLRQRAALYHFQDPELLPLALALKLVFRKCVVYDAYEDFPSMAIDKASVPRLLRPALAAAVALLESLAARCFDGVITADPSTLRRFARTGTSEKLVAYNFPNLDCFPAPRPMAKSFDLVYRGGISDRTGSLLLLDAMHLLAAAGRRVSLLLIGYFDDAAAERSIRARIRALGLDAGVAIRGRIPHEQMSAALSEARIGICPLEDTPKFRCNIPVKIFEYWACALPVVSSDLPPIRPFFRQLGAGLLFHPGRATELAQSIAWLLDHPREAARMGGIGRAAIASRWNNAAEIRKLSGFFERIAPSPHAIPVSGPDA